MFAEAGWIVVFKLCFMVVCLEHAGITTVLVLLKLFVCLIGCARACLGLTSCRFRSPKRMGPVSVPRQKSSRTNERVRNSGVASLCGVLSSD